MNRIPIPKDLKPGDVIVDSRGIRNTFAFYDCDGDARTTGEPVFYPDGRHYDPQKGYAVEIIRANPVKPKRDADAEYLRKIASDVPMYSWESKRLRKIAKRLEQA